MVDAQAPIIVSASRSTDIPAFYADWFFDRLKKGCYIQYTLYDYEAEGLSSLTIQNRHIQKVR